MQVVLDTNVLVSGVFWSGPASRILELWAKDKVEVVVSPAILTEYRRLLAAGDKDLLSMGRVANVEILTPTAFLRRYTHMR